MSPISVFRAVRRCTRRQPLPMRYFIFLTSFLLSVSVLFDHSHLGGCCVCCRVHARRWRVPRHVLSGLRSQANRRYCFALSLLIDVVCITFSRSLPVCVWVCTVCAHSHITPPPISLPIHTHTSHHSPKHAHQSIFRRATLLHTTRSGLSHAHAAPCSPISLELRLYD